jgi:xylan 1,4-beta-xylosidase
MSESIRSAWIRNPILRGFNPDPSICRVGDDYFIATSTFEWYPGVQIHHSRDLVNWRLVARPLDRAGLLDLRGEPDSCGVWAPCLSHAEGKFWLVYTDVKRLAGSFKDAHNYIVTAPAIDGPWSDRIHVNSSGFDPSLFHDDDGRKWVVNMIWNHREAAGAHLRNPAFLGIALQEWDPSAGRLIGEATNIFAGSPDGLVEGPHLFKRKGWYYLTTAEGGTGYDHAVTMARARTIHGPYELHPNVHLITSKDAPEAPLQRAGHGQIVETPEGQVYHTHLCSRPLPGLRRSPLGRETAIQKCGWGGDDWLYLDGGAQVPAVEVPAPFPTAFGPKPAVRRYAFSPDDGLPRDFQWLRTPHPDRIFSLSARPGWLTLIARESIGSWFEQALVARRQEHFAYRAETETDFQPSCFQQAAGLTAYYNRSKFHALAVTLDESAGRSLALFSCLGDRDGLLTYALHAPVALAERLVRLSVRVNGGELQFFYDERGTGWRKVGPILDASILSDEAGAGEHGSFTGAFVGMFAFDTSGAAATADFTHFEYEGVGD